MREIKFRFFDNENKRMYYSDSQNDAKDLGAKLGQSCIATFFNNFYGLDLMQYTGLKDKNGKEIYEGDIIEFKANYTSIERCGYKTGVIVWSDEYMRFEIKVDEFDEPFDCVSETDEWYHKREVIGNIYENSELLNN